MISNSAKFVALKAGQYVRTPTVKMQLVYHHTAGRDNAAKEVEYWNNTKERVATAYLIDRAGTQFQCFDDEYFAFALFVSAKGNQVSQLLKRNDGMLNRGNIGVELTNPGHLTERNGFFHPWYNTKTPHTKEEVIELPYRGYKFWLPYSQAQIDSLEQWTLTMFQRLPHIRDAFAKQDIKGMFEINMDALNGKPGVYNHVCYRTDKTDCFPDPKLIAMLEKLQKSL